MKSAEQCADFARVYRNAAEFVSRERSTTAHEVAARLRADEAKFAEMAKKRSRRAASVRAHQAKQAAHAELTRLEAAQAAKEPK